MTKTAERLLTNCNGFGRVSYSGCREGKAARELEALGLVVRHSASGWIVGPRGQRAYMVEGTIELRK